MSSPTNRVRVANVARWVRAMLAIRAAKWVAGGAVAAGAAAGGIAFAVGSSGPADRFASPSQPFRLEATVRVEDRSRTAGTALAPEASTTNSTISWLYQSNERYRYRVASVSESEGDRVTEVVAEGGNLLTFSDPSNTYQRGPLPDWPKALLPYPGLSLFIGPAPAKSVDELISVLNANNKAPDAFGSITGHETILARKVTLIEFGPTSTSSSSDGGETSSGRGRVWVDESEMVILRYDIESPEVSFSVVVTRFDRPVKHTGDAFRFVPPAGAVERPATTSTSPGRVVSGSGGSSSLGGDGVGGSVGVHDVPGFLRPGYLPPGFRAIGEQTSEDETQTLSRSITFASGPANGNTGPKLTLSEHLRSGGLPDSAKTGEMTPLRGTKAFVRRNGDAMTITWAEGGHVVTIAGAGVPENELRAIAEALTR